MRAERFSRDWHAHASAHENNFFYNEMPATLDQDVVDLIAQAVSDGDAVVAHLVPLVVPEHVDVAMPQQSLRSEEKDELGEGPR